jgi:hypothetical protein
MLLPAYAPPTAADAPPDAAEAGVRYSRYEEDDISEDKVILGDTGRYEIDVVQAHLLTPVGDDWSLALDVQTEHMSGASPWFVGQGLEGEPLVAMSGASISDTRTDVAVTTRYYFMRGNAGFTYAHSDEDDYTSDAVTLDLALNSADGLRTYSVAGSVSDDTIEPTEGVIPVKIESEDKESRSLYLGVSQIISKTAVTRIGLSYAVLDGYLTDPYKLADRRPDRREQWAATAGYRRYFIDQAAALRLDYRFYSDDWGVDSHTLQVEWHQTLGEFALVPYARYYSQSEAEFFAVTADFSQPHYADDYRLSSFGALTLGARLVADLDAWRITLQGERYRSDNGWSLYGGDAAPALVDWWRFTLGLNYRFQ